ncbi:MAG: zinc ribbon domain-containing protein [Planctomycetes bacterium]|nr:zinc ribbon domain-containing protein [Planctomycetota bacterium]
MPTYDYRCRGCGHEFELFQSMSAPLKRKCPECGALLLKRLIGTGGAVIFKGSGFFQTDYRSDSYKKAAEADKKTEARTEKKPDKKADKKTDTTATESSKSPTRHDTHDKGKK